MILYYKTMSGRRNCINNSSFSYTGKEQSPLRFGLSAEGYPVNSILEGFDKNVWVVEIKNNRKIWVKKDDDFTITYELPLINKIEDYNKTINVENELINNTTDDTKMIPKVTKSISKNYDNDTKKDICQSESCVNNIIHNNTPNIANTANNPKNIACSDNVADIKIIKKPTNYNIFLSYRLKQLKEEYKKEAKINKDKEIFKIVINEWNEYKTKPEELKIILEKALSNT